MKIADLRKKSEADLEKQATKLREKISVSKIERVTKDDKNYKQMRNDRKDLARILTLQNETTDSVESATEDKKESK